jgi:hypothetical protein
VASEPHGVPRWWRCEGSVQRRTLRHTVALVLVISGAAGLTCSSSPQRQPGAAYGPAPGLEEYRSGLAGYEFIAESFDPEGTLLGDEEYRALVAKYREEGLGSLSNAERVSLLSVAQTAFLAYAVTLRYSVSSDGPVDAGGVAMVSASLEEVYRHLSMPSVAARRIVGSGISWSWTRFPARDPETPDERREFFEFDPEDAKFVTSMTWDRAGRAWKCATFKGSGGAWGMTHLVHLGRFANYARGEFLGRDVVDGRLTYRLRAEGEGFDPDVVYWLDADTLWLRQYEYELDGIRYTVKLGAINEDITIEPPDVDVPCVEETPSP